MLRKRAQSTLEYVVVLTAIIAAVIAGAALIGRRDNRGGVGRLMGGAGKKIDDATSRLPGVPPRPLTATKPDFD